MKNNIFLMTVFLMITVQTYAVESKKDDQTPFLPPMQLAGNAVISGVVTTHNSAFLSDSLLAPIVYFGGNEPAYALNHFKGNLGETLMNKVIKSQGWQSLSPANTGRNGIDGLYIKLNKAGLPEQLMVADAKVNSAQLGHTKLGKQMSNSWINPKLAQTASSYKNISSVESGAIKIVKTSPTNIKNAIEVPITNKTSAFVWKTSEGYSCFSPKSTIMPEQIREKSSAFSHFLQAASEGKINYRSRLFNYTAKNEQHIISIMKLDSQGNIITESTQWVKGKFANLPKKYQSAIYDSATETLEMQKNVYGLPKYSPIERQALVRQCCDNPEDFNRLCMNPRLSSSTLRAISTKTLAFVLPAGLDIITQYWTTGEVNLKQAVKIGLLGETSTLLGIGTANALTSAGCSSMMASLSGGSMAGAVMSYAMYAMGYCSLSDAHFGAGLGVATAATALTPVVMMSIAATFGTTSTGVAISSLSGAALTNACLAWWGGGAIAAGGGGVAAGTTTIAICYTGVGTLIVAIPIAIYTYKYFSDSAAQERYLRGMIDITINNVDNNIQPEWLYLPSF